MAFDVGRHTFRVDKYQEYKANRASMPDDLRTQLSLIVEGLKAFNIPIYTKEGFEADDVIGTISKQVKNQGDKIYVLTGDRDSFQLVDKDGHIVVIIPQNSALLFYDWQKVYEKMGVYPNQVIDFKALSGDTSDNIPGIRGIGYKTACNLLEKYENLENVYKKY
ncbi:MAG: NYN domain-containing protein [Candidatus Melainabacteria bacterium]|nr:MAG: NYN domain-containing protein [Candidatus Melainabacteria bacterium]